MKETNSLSVLREVCREAESQASALLLADTLPGDRKTGRKKAKSSDKTKWSIWAPHSACHRTRLASSCTRSLRALFDNIPKRKRQVPQMFYIQPGNDWGTSVHPQGLHGSFCQCTHLALIRVVGLGRQAGRSVLSKAQIRPEPSGPSRPFIKLFLSPLVSFI